ncbi:Beta-glucosidase A [Ruegeria denitrificans]|uniref:Beta-glucosidase A n=1 Tax=Ruegeria denitrificans TaxID=1715692 RepID=A0A0P1I9D9_9RHOB|nr:family 1 glycosylhydrolase [Ruegeria denitrificans]CUJ99133.1 Beta-glucosidase A [Ruegeria denitrificans]
MNYIRSDFPEEFLFGLASSAQAREQEFDLARETGLDCYQFSINWARVLPEGRGALNEDGLDQYDRLIDTLLTHGIRPWATLCHEEVPAALADLGGWRNRDIAGWFADFTEVIMGRIGDRMHGVASISAPSGIGDMRHFRIQTQDIYKSRATARAMHHLLLAHGHAIDRMRGLGMSNLGISFDHANAEQQDVGETHPIFDVCDHFFASAVFNKTYPATVAETLDAHLSTGWQDDFKIIGAQIDWCGLSFAGHSQAAGNMVRQLSHFQQDYSQDLPIIVIENGATNLEGSRQSDDLSQHLNALQDALKMGVPLKGVFVRSLRDRDTKYDGPSDPVTGKSRTRENQSEGTSSSYRSAFSNAIISSPRPQTAGTRHNPWDIVADIGGTNTRLGVIADGKLTDLRKYPTGSLPDLLDAFHALRDEIGTDPRAVVAAGAGPVKEGTIRLTNAKLDLSEDNIGKATGAQHTFVINDFTAAAWSVAEITGEDVEVLQGAATPRPGTRLVVGPGTGLGVGALLYSKGRYHTASGEGGHIGLSPRHEDEVEIFKAARHVSPNCFFDDTLVLEAEMFLSGTGLPILYRAIGMADGQTDTPERSAKDILEAARAQVDPIAEKTANMFTTYLGAMMGDLAVVLMPVGGVFLVGGVAEKNRWLFTDAFRDAFNAGGRFSDLRKSMSLYVSEQKEFGIIGANNFCKNALAR